MLFIKLDQFALFQLWCHVIPGNVLSKSSFSIYVDRIHWVGWTKPCQSSFQSCSIPQCRLCCSRAWFLCWLNSSARWSSCRGHKTGIWSNYTCICESAFGYCFKYSWSWYLINALNNFLRVYFRSRILTLKVLQYMRIGQLLVETLM